MSEPVPTLTLLLHRATNGDREALQELLAQAYHELHRLAENALHHDRPGHTLQPTALVNEAFLRIFGDSPPSFQDRAHFLSLVARVMRRVLVDYARARHAQKRGGGLQVTLTDAMAANPAPTDLLLLDEALDRLGQEDPRLVTLIEMRFFSGMTAEETAQALNESVHVIRHDIRYAQARLRQAIESGPLR
jgi:RNA polymerase sigma factor (TIGR02999 family)